MYSVVVYSYEEKKASVLEYGSKRDMQELIESYCIDYIASIQGNRVSQFKDIVKQKGYLITKEDWDNNIRLWITKSNNFSKYTIKQMNKNIGYLYNSFETKKVLSIYLVQTNIPYEIDYNYEPAFVMYDDFDKVMDIVGNKYDTINDNKDGIYEILNIV